MPEVTQGGEGGLFNEKFKKMFYNIESGVGL